MPVPQPLGAGTDLTRRGIGARRLRRETRSVPAVAGTGSLRLEVRTTGPREDGLPPVVLVEGYAVGNAYLLPLAGVLAKRLAVHVPDLPGHGHSDHDARPLTLREQAGVLEDWMRGSGLAGAVVVGHSTGCQIAAELTRAAPELVSGLVLVGPTSDARARSVPRQLARGLAGSTVDGPTYLLWSLTDYVRAGPAVLRAEMRQMIDHHIEDVLPGIGVPVRVVRGGFDLIVQPAWARTVAAIARAPRPTSVPRWGHAVHYDSPRPVARVVHELVDEPARNDRR